MKTLADPEIRRAVEARLRRLQPASKALWGVMSAHQMLCHLADSYDTAVGTREARSISNLFSRTVMKYVALNTNFPWPKGVPTLAEVKQGAGGCGSAPSAFEADRERALASMDDFLRRGPEHHAPTHPLFGAMNHRDWLRWGYLHADHHLRQFGV